MASGKKHAKATKWILAPTIVGAGIFSYSVLQMEPWQAIQFGLLSGLGNVMTLYINPDQDQESLNRVEYKWIHNTIGLFFLCIAFWGPYAVLVPHRNWFSHFPIVGTIFRYAYLKLGIGLLIFVLTKYPVPEICYTIRWYDIAVVLGMAISDILHWIMDW